ncbi:MAG: hypothetical protein R3330_09570 [Saprospiraceae bacterium]|nr:hypothetical protein [Saprospiraceae bacterium]
MNFIRGGKVWQWALGATFLVLVVNVILPSWSNGFPETLNTSVLRLIDNPTGDEWWRTHVSNPEFAKRPVVTTLQSTLHSIGVPYQLSFNLINYTALFCVILLLYKVAGKFHQRPSGPLLVIATGMSFSIVFAFLGAMHTYDDFIQYICILLALLLLLEHQWIWSALILGIGMIARETTVLFLPMFLVYTWKYGTPSRLLNGVWVLPVLCYVTWLMLMDRTMLDQTVAFTLDGRFLGWKSNFANPQMTAETVSVIFMVVGLPCALLVARWKSLIQNHEHRLIALQVVFLIIVNTILVSVAAASREARLFFLPMIVLYPLLIKEASILLHAVRSAWRQPILTITAISLAFAAGLFVYTPSLGGTGIVYKVYFIGYTTVFMLFIFGLLAQSKPARRMVGIHFLNIRRRIGAQGVTG